MATVLSNAAPYCEKPPAAASFCETWSLFVVLEHVAAFKSCKGWGYVGGRPTSSLQVTGG
jgi:hypothetical protein